MLFAQLAVSAYACPADQASPESMRADQPCASMDPDLPGLCQLHCEDGQQIVKTGPDVPPVGSFMPVMGVVLTGILPPPIRALSAPALEYASPPPLAIRHCCFRI